MCYVLDISFSRWSRTAEHGTMRGLGFVREPRRKRQLVTARLRQEYEEGEIPSVHIYIYIYNTIRTYRRPPLWSSGQSSWLQIQKSRVPFPALLHFLRSNGSGTESTQPREDNWATWIYIYKTLYLPIGDRLCGLVARVLGYRSRDPGFHSRRYYIFWEVLGLERSPLSLVRISELLE
jgi:hypothetical protein